MYSKTILLMAAAVFTAVSMPALAQTQNPPVRIYQFTGVYQNDGTENTGTATVFTCTNFSGVSASLRFLIRDELGVTVYDTTRTLGAKRTYSYSTKGTAAHTEFQMGIVAALRNASMAISSSELEVRCMGKVTPAASTEPGGYVLPHARFFQTTDTQE